MCPPPGRPAVRSSPPVITAGHPSGHRLRSSPPGRSPVAPNQITRRHAAWRFVSSGFPRVAVQIGSERAAGRVVGEPSRRRPRLVCDSPSVRSIVSGHSKWATTKHKKAVIDAKRSKLFAKLIKNIEVAARVGGDDMAGNPTLFDAVLEGQEVLGPQRQHRSRAQARLRPRGRRRRVRDDHVRGVRAQRRGHPDRVPHRQPQPRGDGGPHRPHAQQRHPRRTPARSATSSVARARSS